MDGMLASADNFARNNMEKKSEYDLNNREAFSGTSSPQRQGLVSLEAREEMEKIERIVQQ